MAALIEGRTLRCPHRRWNSALLVAGILAALATRYALLPFESGDYAFFYGRWYDFAVDNGFLVSLQRGPSNYNVLYQYLLALTATLADFLPWRNSMVELKVFHAIFDFVLATFVYKCVAIKYRDATAPVPILGGLAALLAPTVVLNASAWANVDAGYTACLVACLYFLLAGRQACAFLAFGLAISFKLQAVFMAPLFLWLFVKGELHWRHFALAPLVYLALLVPAWLVGIPLEDLLLVYLRQLGWFGELTMGMANLYAWIPNSYYPQWPLGVFFAACLVSLVTVAIYRSAVKVTPELVVFLATFCLLLVPYTLPKMHERFFFPADVVAIVLAFHLPRYWYVPVVIGAVSLCQYANYLIDVQLVPIEWLALVPLGLLAVLSWQLHNWLRNPGDRSSPPAAERPNRLNPPRPPRPSRESDPGRRDSGR